MEFTESAIVDKINEIWSHYKDKNNSDWRKQASGMFYYHSFTESIWSKKPLEIYFKHFSQDLLEQFERILKSNPMKLRWIFKRAIIQYFHRYGEHYYDNADKEGLLRVKFV